ncbi:MAG: polyprenyl synthetase family protein [Sedimentisphaerales bacterium]|nr:polyprenyl synthetase family protein [Sedimentisphaerales bacterium]
MYEYLCVRSGKMIRPGLVLLAGRCAGPTTPEHLKAAAVVEMIHTATLLHDDVIDDGQRRRGAPTINRLCGNESAVLLGDFVLSCVFKLAADFEPKVAKVIGQTAVRVCEGELRQVIQKRNWQLDEDAYIDIITEKSAAFFSGCCRIGAMLAGAPDDQVEALSQYGLYAGIAFQIADDVLDIAGDEEQMGKAARNDLDTSKLTLAVIHLLAGLDESERQSVCAMLESPAESKTELARLLHDRGSLQYARRRAQAYVTQAVEALEAVPSGPGNEALVEIVRFMADRTM